MLLTEDQSNHGNRDAFAAISGELDPAPLERNLYSYRIQNQAQLRRSGIACKDFAPNI